MTVVAIVQARMTSTRLPGKVLADLGGAPMLERVVARARAASRIDAVWVACTDRTADDPIAAWCRGRRVECFRGSEVDVLGRYRAAALAAGAAVVVRLTGDCPLLDPATIDRVVAALNDGAAPADYAANVLERSFPRGLDVEAFTASALERLDRLGISAASREHVTLGARLEHPEAFAVRSVRAATDDSDLRWTVDAPEDLTFVRTLFQSLGLADRILRYEEVVRWCRSHPGLARSDDPDHTWDPSRERPEPTTRRPLP